MGDGGYRRTYRFEPPSKAGFIRHVDNESGVPTGGSHSQRAGLSIIRAGKPTDGKRTAPIDFPESSLILTVMSASICAAERFVRSPR
jgi:hypothetical protein